MLIQIKNRWTGNLIFEGEFDCLRDAVAKARANLYGANLSGANLSGADLSGANLSGANLSGANLSGANLSGANLSRANLSGANLSGADLSRANLSGANLSGANLSRANLSRADLSGANLSGAEGVNKFLTTDLHILTDQPGKIRAYKLVTSEGTGPWNRGIFYKKGESVSVDNANCNENDQCGAGINLATLNWVMREWHEGYRILIAEFTAKDIASIPIGSDGKFRVHRCKIVGEKNLVELGLIKDEKP